MLGNFSRFFCHLLPIFKINFQKDYFRITIRVSHGLDPDSVGPVLGPNCMQMLSADDKSPIITYLDDIFLYTHITFQNLGMVG